MSDQTPIPAAAPARTFPPYLRQWVDFCCDHSGYGCGHHIDGHGAGGGSCRVRRCRCTVWRDHVGCDHRVRDAAEQDAYAAGLAAGRTAAAAAADARWDEGHRAGWIEGRAEGLDAGRSEAAATIRAKAANYVGEQFRHFEMCARLADGQRVPNTRQDAAAARVAENGADQ